MQPTTIELRFRADQASAAEIQVVVDEVLAELRDETTEAAEKARKAVLDPPTLANARVDISEQGHGLDPLTVIVVGITIRAGSHVAIKLWDDVLWPRLRRRLGGRAVGEKIN
jgi:hypothetical protein